MQSFKEQSWDAFARIDNSDCLFKVFQTVSIESFDISKDFVGSTDTLESLSTMNSFIDNNRFKIGRKKILILLNAYGHSANEIKTLFDYATDNFNSCLRYLVIFSDIAAPYSNDKAVVQHVPCATELEYARKVARHVEILLSNQPKGSTLKPSKASYPEKIITISDLKKDDIKFDDNYILNINDTFQMFMSLKSKSQKLLIMGQDAITRSKVDLPLFFRWSWATELPYSVIVLNDPTLYIDDTLNGGWFVGTETEDYAQIQADMISKIVQWFKLDNKVTFFGVSAGGFSSLMLATCYGENAQAIIDIPQIDLQTYYKQNEVLNLFRSAFGVNNTAVPADIQYRVDVTKRFEKYGFIPNIKYLYNVQDKAHSQQFNYLINRWSELAHKLDQDKVGDLTLHTYSKWHLSKGGHVPLNKQESFEQIISYIQ
ncbi:hypothetical protein R0I52_06475 [Psychrobacter sp. CAM01]|uniref:hypothetical protein n=1 Tax=Psychrobacter sp. CAM01 TaxID=3080335 RepID=UPI002936BBFD|nr:hypothetical protein [Psychrobacter sp. CAM01]MDV2860353.1 hypothetical protein [Psychrobacter sp. CAM01]